jgi:hypothetical protein
MIVSEKDENIFEIIPVISLKVNEKEEIMD